VSVTALYLKKSARRGWRARQGWGGEALGRQEADDLSDIAVRPES